MKNLLNDIKEQLFDAPNDVKESFNKLVEYFDTPRSIRDTLNSIEGVSDIVKTGSGSDKFYNFKYKNKSYVAWNGPDMYLVLIQRVKRDDSFDTGTSLNTCLFHVKDFAKVLNSI